MPKVTLKQLQNRCREAGLKTTGTKAALIERLEGFHAANSNLLQTQGFQTANSNLVQTQSQQQLIERIERLEASLRAASMERSGNDMSNDDDMRPPTTFAPPRASSPRVTFAQPMTQFETPTSLGDGSCPVTVSVSTPVTSINSVPVFSRTYVPPVSHAVYQPVFSQQQTLMPGRWHPETSGAFMQNAPQQYLVTATANGTARCPPIIANTGSAPQTGPGGAGFGHMQDMIAILPEFDPLNENSLSSNQFVQRVQILKNAYQWRDDLLIFAAQQKMKGHAKLWIDAQREVFVTWSHFAQNLIQAFPCDVNPADAHIKLASTKRLLGELPKEYYFKMFALGNKYGLHENAIARYIVNGINDEDLRKKISNDYSECIHLLRDIESYCRYKEVKGPGAKPKYAQTTSSMKNKGANSDKREERRIKCYNCAKLGHISTNCPEPQRKERCKICNKWTHATKDCPSSRKTNVNTIEAQQSENGELVTYVKINNSLFKAFVDSGSTRSLIRSSVVHNFEDLTDCRVNLNGFGGGTFMCTKQLEAEVEIDGQRYAAKLLVVDDQLINYDILLGRDILCQQGKRIVIESQKCWIETVDEIAAGSSHMLSEYCELNNNILTWQHC